MEGRLERLRLVKHDIFIVFVIVAELGYYKSVCLGLWCAEALECGQFIGEVQANTEMLNLFLQSINRPCELQGHLQWKHCLVTTDWNVHIGALVFFHHAFEAVRWAAMLGWVSWSYQWEECYFIFAFLSLKHFSRVPNGSLSMAGSVLQTKWNWATLTDHLTCNYQCGPTSSFCPSCPKEL